MEGQGVASTGEHWSIFLFHSVGELCVASVCQTLFKVKVKVVQVRESQPAPLEPPPPPPPTFFLAMVCVSSSHDFVASFCSCLLLICLLLLYFVCLFYHSKWLDLLLFVLLLFVLRRCSRHHLERFCSVLTACAWTKKKKRKWGGHNTHKTHTTNHNLVGEGVVYGERCVYMGIIIIKCRRQNRNRNQKPPAQNKALPICCSPIRKFH